MPAQGVDLTPSDRLMTSGELARVIRVFASAGVDKIRFTGGEPLIRRDLCEIVRRTSAEVAHGVSMGVTTNGILLERQAQQLKDAGVSTVNVSLDTLDPQKFEIITRRRGHARVLRAIDKCLEVGIPKVKVNCVIMRNINDGELIDFVEYARYRPIEVRFIEYMPFQGNFWKDSRMVPSQELVEIIRHAYPDATFQRCSHNDGANDVSKTWMLEGMKGCIGFITSMSDNFCSSCNRIRLTADGNLKVCLFGHTEVNLLDVMRRQNATNAELLQVIQAAVMRKKARHAGMHKIAEETSAQSSRPMTTIGG